MGYQTGLSLTFFLEQAEDKTSRVRWVCITHLISHALSGGDMKNKKLYEKFKIQRIHVPITVLFETQKHLRTHGRIGHEGLA